MQKNFNGYLIVALLFYNTASLCFK